MAEIHLRSRHRPSDADIVPSGLRRVMMVVEYDGTAYSGWQRQANAPSVQQCMEEAFTALTGEQVPVIGGDGIPYYPQTTGEFAAIVRDCHANGANILGGCCGTSPDFIRAVKHIL